MKKNMHKSKIKKALVLVLLLNLTLFTLISKLGVITIAAPEPIGGNYYISDYENKEEVTVAANELNERIYGEGVTLLKNEDNALPLLNGSRISLFGKNSGNILQSGSGSSSGVGSRNVTLEESLQNAGFILNPALVNFYKNNNASGSGRGPAPTNGNVPSGYNTGETPVNMYTAEIEQTYENYDDAAIVVFQRIAGEGFDLPRTMTWNGSDYRTWSKSQVVPGARSGDDHYLQLDKNESDLLKYLGNKFDKVIVLLNTGSQFEAGFLDDPSHYGYHENVKAALWIGYPGGTGLNALGKILKGEINPSGRTTDTYARDFKQDPTWMNFGNNLENNGNRYNNISGSGGHGGAGYINDYVYYQEGIYVGYRYYETRGYTDGEAWYNNAVVYPFGHGLSYTTFEQEVITQSPLEGERLLENETIEVTVKVTNTGQRAGKEVVQLYYTSPYTEGEIEKSHVVLGAFEKTKLLQPGESEEVVLTIKARDLASYDFDDANNNGFKGYELEAGEYTIRIMKNAHEEWESFTYSVNEDIQIATDDATNNQIENRFDDVSKEIDTYLSRSNWDGTFPTTALKITANQDIINKVNEWRGGNNPADEGKPYYSSERPEVGNDTGSIKLADLIGLDYDDPLWTQFLNQLSFNTLEALATTGSYSSGIELSELGITRVVNADSPAGWVNWSWGTHGGLYTLYSSETILAATWNKEISYEKGRMIGNEALFGNGGSRSRFPGWYAPAINIHRSPFGGRNFEYYSEDGYLSGILAAEVVKGAKDKGVFTYVKHFGVNEQETYRVGLLTWASEQSMREIYLRSFEITVKEGKTSAMMSGLNRIGAVWAGGSYELLTEILRDEWGFKGMVVTDTFLGGYSNIDQMIRAGGDLSLGNVNGVGFNRNSTTTHVALRNAAHNILFTHANSMAMNTGYSTQPPALSVFNGGLLEVGVANVQYSANVATVTINKELFPNANDNEIVYSLKEGSVLPEGIVLNSDGSITGIAMEEINNHTFIVQAKYLSFVREATFTISITDPMGSIIYQVENNPDIAFVDKEYSFSVDTAYIFKPDATQTEIDNFPTITYELKSGHLMPEGLRLLSDGTITGIPRKVIKDYEFIVVASALGYKEREASLKISIFNEVTFEGQTMENGKFGIPYLSQIDLATGSGNIKYKLKDNNELPDGLKMTEGGFIYGTPNKVVLNHKFVVVATSDYSIAQEAEYTISIGVVYNEISLPYGETNKEYDLMINTAQGAPNIKYTLKEGAKLPKGLTLTEDGILSGRPTEAGTFKFTIIAKANDYIADENEMTLFIDYSDSSTNNNSTIIIFVSVGVVLIGIGTGLFIFFKKRTKNN